MIWPILFLTLVGIMILVPDALSNLGSIEIVMLSSVALGLLVLAEGLCLLSGHFDLSIGAIAGFSAMLTGMIIGDCTTCWGLSHDPFVGFFLVLAIGGIIGLLNGLFIAKLGINPFLQTLAFLIIFTGATYALSTQPVTGLPELYTYPGGSSRIAIGTLLAAFVVFGYVMKHTTFGQAVYAVGSNKESARAVGINTDRVIISVYVISGLLSGLAGLMLTGYVSVVPPSLGDDMVFPAFAAAVIGGISLFGGRGKISGALGGVILLGMIQAALNISGVDATRVEMINGVVLLIAIVLYNTRRSIRDKILTGSA